MRRLAVLIGLVVLTAAACGKKKSTASPPADAALSPEQVKAAGLAAEGVKAFNVRQLALAKEKFMAALTLDPTSAAAKQGLDELQAFENKLKKPSGDLDPPVAKGPKPAPDFPDGSYRPSTVMADPGAFLGEVTIAGKVVWIYDCRNEIGPEAAQQEPHRCERPNLYLANQSGTPKEKALWVVEVPRAPRPDEVESLPPEELQAWPIVPELAVDQVMVVKGVWGVKSPKGITKAEGLLTWVAEVREEPAGVIKQP